MGVSKYLIANKDITHAAVLPVYATQKTMIPAVNHIATWGQTRSYQLSWLNCHPYLYVYLTATNSGGRSQHLVLGSSQLLGAGPSTKLKP